MEALNKIMEYILLLEPQIEKTTLEFYIRELIDRVLAYTNRKEIPEMLYRILAKEYVKNHIKEKRIEENGDVESITDNGQTIKFRSKEENKKDFFEDLKAILDPYVIKKAKVIGEEKLENTK